MAGRGPGSAAQGMRERLAQEAARIMIEQGVRDFAVAKRKASERLGPAYRNVLPGNAQIEACLAERQRIFEPEGHSDRLRKLRRIAGDVMAKLAPIETRLVGSVLSGTATINAVIEIHAFCDLPEELAQALQLRAVDYRPGSKRYRMSQKTSVDAPVYRFRVETEEVMIVVFPFNGIRQAPLSPVDQKPMRRARRDQIPAVAGS